MIYDIFYVSQKLVYEDGWKKLRERFPTAQKIDNVKTIDDIKRRAFTRFFWVVWDNTIVDSSFNFDYRVSDWDKDYIHVFKTLKHNQETYIGGICLFPKHVSISQKEFDYKFYINKKEIDQVISKFRYPVYTINSFEEYLDIANSIDHPLFWNVPDDVEVIDSSIFELFFDPQDGAYDHDRNENHVFKNGDFYDGVMLLSTSKLLSKKEFDFRFPITKKEWQITVSNPKPYDIFFISYNEPNADENYKKLADKFPKAKRVHGVKGIHNAHIEAARQSETEKFWVVDADAVLMDDFNFQTDYYPHYDSGNRQEHLLTVFVWQSKNPVNDLTYGYGGVKLLPRQLTLEMKTDTHDMTTSISDRFKVVPKVSNITAFNIDDFSTWRSAFRECAKLASKVIDSNYDDETDERLYIWCSKTNDKVATAGAREGRKFGRLNIDEPDELRKINDFDWLKDRYETWKQSNEQ